MEVFIGVEGYLLIKGDDFNNEYHKHSSIQISLENSGVVVEGNREIFRGSVIASGVKHKLKKRKNQIILLIDIESKFGKHIEDCWLKGREYIEIDFGIDKTSNLESIFWSIKKYLGHCKVEHTIENNHVREALEIIENLEQIKITLEELGKKLYISPSRLHHLFSEEVGIPLRKYLLYKRLMMAVGELKKGKSATYAAHESGFSDSAHLSRTFKENFGISYQYLIREYGLKG